jgi:hypothetical protein
MLWLMAVALPLQGVAVATMLSCGPGHHRMAAAQTAAPVMHDHSAHDHGTVANDAKPSAAAADDGPAAEQLHSLAKFKCSACAACCSATALPSSAIGFDPPRLEAVFDALPLASSATFQTGGLERPPRQHFV